MNSCIQLAALSLGIVAPNPMVGCVIVVDDKIIGEGYHQSYGEAHAEVNAINSIADKELLNKATLYVNLEPCSHFGKTPPCADLIIQYKIPKVVIGSLDSNSLVSGKGIDKLNAAGITVKVGVLEEQCRELNKRFYTFYEKKRPYVILKWAQTTDNFIDNIRDENDCKKPLTISNDETRKIVHQWRSEEQAIMVGSNTALLDNPKLTVREVAGKNPLRITIDKWNRIPKDYFLFDKTVPTLIFSNEIVHSEHNLEYVKIDFEKDVIAQMMHELYFRNIQSLILEGGSQLLNSFINTDNWDEARVIVSKQAINKGVKAPVLDKEPIKKENILGDTLFWYLSK